MSREVAPLCQKTTSPLNVGGQNTLILTLKLEI